MSSPTSTTSSTSVFSISDTIKQISFIVHLKVDSMRQVGPQSHDWDYHVKLWSILKVVTSTSSLRCQHQIRISQNGCISWLLQYLGSKGQKVLAIVSLPFGFDRIFDTRSIWGSPSVQPVIDKTPGDNDMGAKAETYPFDVLFFAIYRPLTKANDVLLMTNPIVMLE